MVETNAVLIGNIPLFQHALTDVLKRAGVSRVICRTAAQLPCEFGCKVALVVASLSIIDARGSSAIVRLENDFPDAALVVTAEHPDRRRVFELLAQGIDGFIPETLLLEEMVDAFRQVLSGRTFVPVFEQEESADAPQKALLTARQKQIVGLMQRGLTNKEIARELSISPGTVKVHLNTVYRALGAHNRVAALAALEGQDIHPARELSALSSTRQDVDPDPDFLPLLFRSG